MFDELMGTTIDFSGYVMNRLNIDNLTQEILVGRGFNLLKGTCKSFAELEYHFEECCKAVNDKLNWNNLEGHAYPFDLSKPLLLIKDQGRQVVPVDYFINNDLEGTRIEAANTKMQHDQGNVSGHIDDQLYNEAAPTYDWFQKPDKPLTPYRPWN
nr:hypothetical protein [Tanacetum cinerariifolium]